MTSDIPLTLQTAYAELLDRCASAAFTSAFGEDGHFTPKTVRGRRYWYFQVTLPDGTRKQRYVGPETPELLERIASNKAARNDRKERRTLVSTLVRSARLPRPQARIGEVVAALAQAGVFRLRGVLIGTVAYQTYPAMLGTRLPAAALQTGDVDIAQFRNVSVAVGERLPGVLDTLKQVDPSFRAVPHLHDPRRVTSYVASYGIRVDFLSPNKGSDSDAPAPLPALGTDAQQLRFLDFLIHDPEPAVLLYGEGVYVLVPLPQRYAVHKLIVARRRKVGSAKIGKDLQQAEALLDALARKHPHELTAAWLEASGRGRTWRRLIGEGLGQIDAMVRDRVLKVVGVPRSVIPRLALTCSARYARYDSDRDAIVFSGEAGGAPVRCAVSREALEDHFGAGGMDQAGRLETFRKKRATFESMAQGKYLAWPVEEPGSVIIRAEDVDELRRKSSSRSTARAAQA